MDKREILGEHITTGEHIDIHSRHKGKWMKGYRDVSSVNKT